MSILTDKAAAAYRAELDAAAAEVESQRRALRTAATEAVRAVVGSTLTEAGLQLKDADVAAGRVVWSDGTVSLGSILREGEWRVYLVGVVDGQWTRLSGRLRDLSDLGEALAAQPKPEPSPTTEV